MKKGPWLHAVEREEKSWAFKSAKKMAGNVSKFAGVVVVRETLDVLCGAERHGGNDVVVSPLQNAQRAGLFLRGVFSMVNVQVRKYVTEDDLKAKRRRETTSLPPDMKKYIVHLRRRALEDIRETRATDTMSQYELDLLGESDEGLLEELGKDKSFFKLLGLDRFDETTTLGFMEWSIFPLPALVWVSPAYQQNPRQLLKPTLNCPGENITLVHRVTKVHFCSGRDQAPRRVLTAKGCGQVERRIPGRSGHHVEIRPSPCFQQDRHHLRVSAVSGRIEQSTAVTTPKPRSPVCPSSDQHAAEVTIASAAAYLRGTRSQSAQ